MAFDSTTSDYLKVSPAKVYDKDNPPKTMSEAIRMAVADVELQEAAGIQYNWSDCSRCTAGAVVRRMAGTCDKNGGDWEKFGEQWGNVLDALSLLTCPSAGEQDTNFRDYSRAFGSVPLIRFKLTSYGSDPEQFKADMLALADRLEAEAS